MTRTVTTSTLSVPGAELYFERRGAGPLMLIIPGGPQDAGVFAGLAEHLADRYTLLTYDPRANSRSKSEGDAAPLRVDVEADDAAALIAAEGDGPAYVFGTSGGAQIGLDLAARHPERVAALVAHEPPAMMLLDDPSEMLAADEALHETYRRDGVEAAMAEFFAMNGLEGGDEDGPPNFEMPPEEAETFERVSGNFEYWLAQGMLPLSRYEPDVAALRAGTPKIVVGLGSDSAGQPIAEMSEALAKRLGVEPVPFPGDHMGFETDAAAFAAALDQALRG